MAFMEAPWGGDRPPQPEWPGATSAKFADPFTGKERQKRVVPSQVRNGPEEGLARNGFARYFTDTAGLVASQGKLQVFVPPGEVCEWRPSRRCLSHPGANHYEKPEGLRRVEEPPRQNASLREKRHIRMVESKEEFSDRPVGPKVTYRQNGLRSQDQPAKEVDVAMEMARKVRPLDMLTKRNGIGCAALGDKCYRHPEYQTGFHITGGLIVGSTFQRGSFKKTEPRNSTSLSQFEGSLARRAVTMLTFHRMGFRTSGGSYYKAGHHFLYHDADGLPMGVMAAGASSGFADAANNTRKPFNAGWVLVVGSPGISRLEDLDNDPKCRCIARIDSTVSSTPPMGTSFWKKLSLENGVPMWFDVPLTLASVQEQLVLEMPDSERKVMKSYYEKQQEQDMQEAQSEVQVLTKAAAAAGGGQGRSWEASILKECDTGYEEPSESSDEEDEGSPP